MSTSPIVSWNTYAQKYDMLLSYNPYYQDLHQSVLQFARQWDIQAGDHIADIGAGTGNYSLSLAKMYPQAKILHIDNDEGMNEAAMIKREQQSVYNHSILDWTHRKYKTSGCLSESFGQYPCAIYIPRPQSCPVQNV